VASFLNYEVGGDALLVEMCGIQMGLDLCRNKSDNNIICESEC
jgi:hypothetical protein